MHIVGSCLDAGSKCVDVGLGPDLWLEHTTGTWCCPVHEWALERMLLDFIHSSWIMCAGALKDPPLTPVTLITHQICIVAEIRLLITVTVIGVRIKSNFCEANFPAAVRGNTT